MVRKNGQYEKYYGFVCDFAENTVFLLLRMRILVINLVKCSSKLSTILKKDEVNRTIGCEVIPEKLFGHVTEVAH